MITSTPEAREHLLRLWRDLDDPTVSLRVDVRPGGCSGFSYDMFWDHSKDDDESFLLDEDLSVVVNHATAPLVDGAEIDYIDSLMGGGFTLHNPNAVSTCSCGHSFDAANGSEMPSPCS
jgi:iron-sulfur cluster assembly protein